jgi:small ligand-binding sensory domain FIST
MEDGSGAFFGDVPTGTMANICLVNKEDIAAACRESMNALLEEMKTAGDYQYSTIFCISCCGRAMILGGDSDAEGRIIAGLLPDAISLAGAYCLGEICPALHKDGEVSNRFHNCSITFCMI